MSNSPDPNQASPDQGQPTDPYSEFLCLPPGPRPPHLYQLLGIEIFCPHPEQIEYAARKQFRKIKPFEEHPDRTVRNRIQDIITHIATARVVLSDPEQRLEYDRKLAEHLKIDRDQILRSRTAARLPEYELHVTAGPTEVGTRLRLLPDRVITIGSHPDCALCLPGARPQPMHAQLEYLDNDWILRTKDTSYVTLINDQRCREFLLADGDTIDIGGYRLSFQNIGTCVADGGSLPPPLSLVVRAGPSIPDPVLNALPPTSILIGHCETALWQLPGALVSRHHARIASVGSLWEITDLQSTNGTILNDEQVSHAVLRHRDRLAIGRFEIQVSLRR